SGFAGRSGPRENSSFGSLGSFGISTASEGPGPFPGAVPDPAAGPVPCGGEGGDAVSGGLLVPGFDGGGGSTAWSGPVDGSVTGEVTLGLVVSGARKAPKAPERQAVNAAYPP